MIASSYIQKPVPFFLPLSLIAFIRNILKLALSIVRMSSAAEQVFENHVIYRNLLKYLAKSTLVSVLVIEQRGDRFNWCVRELYATVDHDVVGNMARDSVGHLEAFTRCSELTFPGKARKISRCNSRDRGEGQ